MPDKEKVIKGLECHYEGLKRSCNFCPYKDEWACQIVLCGDALALLREQEFATEFILDDYQPTCKTCGFKPFVGYIPKIEWMKERGYKYCPGCGRAVKWR